MERDSYLLELCRYIVLNPVRANMVRDEAHYEWSSYLASMGKIPAPHWLETDWLLNQFDANRSVGRRRYGEFVAQGMENASPWSALKGQVLLGREQFVNELQPLLNGKSGVKEFPQAQRVMTRPALNTLFNERVKGNKALRTEAIREACVEHGYSMADIARMADVHYSTVSRVIKGER